MATKNEFLTVVQRNGKPKYRYRPHRGQQKMLLSKKRFILVLAGTQGGKTSSAPLWMYREIHDRGPGDYLVVAPTYPLMQKKLLPEFRSFFEYGTGLGKYVGGSVKELTIRKEIYPKIWKDPILANSDETTRLMFGHAQDPESLESATAKGAVLDEAGQKKFKAGSYEAILRRLSINQGRVLLPTTPYNLGWLYQRLYRPWKDGTDPDIDVIRFESTMNPVFPVEEFERAKRVLPKWKFDMFYRGIFTRPAGIIYDCFDEDAHVVPDFPIPKEWPRYLGLDFGGTNTAGLYVAEHDGKYYIYNEYWPRLQRTAAEHKEYILRGETGLPTAVGGAKSEGQWRDEFSAAGLPVKEPDISEVELGISRFYGLIQDDRVRVLAGCKHFLEEIMSYARELDDNDEPTEKIEDKNEYHLLDGARYIFGWLSRHEPDYGLDTGWVRW